MQELSNAGYCAASFSAMKTIFLDTNVFDRLAKDAQMRYLLSELSTNKTIQLLISRTVRDELSKSPHMGLLSSLPVEIVPNATPIVGLMCAGDFLGDAEQFFLHKGDSTKVNDAQIANAAAFHGGWLVSDDRRLRQRLRLLPNKVEAMTYTQFVEAVLKLP